MRLPSLVRRRALAEGHERWLAALPGIVADLAAEWELRPGAVLEGGSAGLVVAVTDRDGGEAVLKVMPPESSSLHEIVALRLAAGRGAAAVLRSHGQGAAVLLERLGEPLSAAQLPAVEALEVMADTVAAMWRAVPAEVDLPTGRWKAGWLCDWIERAWQRQGRPCPRGLVESALAALERRVAADRGDAAVLVHGDVHADNVLRRRGGGWALIDPDGLRAEPEYDLGVLLREVPAEEDLRGWAVRLAARNGCDPVATWDWGLAELVSTGLMLRHLGEEEEGRRMLVAAARARG